MAKTPVSVLQEHCAKKGIAPPQYDLIHSRADGVNPEFKYQVTCEDVIAIGSGRSKKEAKHNAADTAIVKLQYQKLNSSKLLETGPLGEPVASPYSNLVQRNYVGELMTMCAENNLPEPKFDEVGAEGPSHAPCFTISCTISQFTETAQSSTKKQAKQLAAKKLFNRVTECLKDVIKAMPQSPQHQRVGEDEERMFARLHNVPNIPATIIPNSINELELALERTYRSVVIKSLRQVEVDRDCTSWNPVIRLKEVAAEMGVPYQLNVKIAKNLKSDQDFDQDFDDDIDDYTTLKVLRTAGTSAIWFGCVILETHPLSTVMAQGPSQAEAERKVAEKTLRYLSIMIEGSSL